MLGARIHYRCSTCGKLDVAREQPPQCLICLNVVCRTCYSEGLCPHHFSQLSSGKQQVLREYMQMRQGKARKQDIAAYITIPVAVIYFTACILIGLTAPGLPFEARVAILVLPPVEMLAGITLGIYFHSQLKKAQAAIAEMFEGHPDNAKGGQVGLQNDRERTRELSPSLAPPPEVAYGGKPKRVPPIFYVSLPEFHAAMIAWKTGQYPLDPKQSDVLIVRRNAGVYWGIVAYMSVYGAGGGLLIFLGLMFSFSSSFLTFIIFLPFGIYVIGYLVYAWKKVGIKGQVLFLNGKGFMCYKRFAPFYVPWQDVVGIRENRRKPLKGTIVEIELNDGQCLWFLSALWEAPELAWMPPFLEERLSLEGYQSILTRLKVPSKKKSWEKPPLPSLYQILHGYRSA